MKSVSVFLAALWLSCAGSFCAFGQNAVDVFGAASPEGAYVCLAGKMRGQEGGPACTTYTNAFFSIWVPDKLTCSAFATMGARYRYLVIGTNVPNDDFTLALIETFGGCVGMPYFPPPTLK